MQAPVPHPGPRLTSRMSFRMVFVPNRIGIVKSLSAPVSWLTSCVKSTAIVSKGHDRVLPGPFGSLPDRRDNWPQLNV
jgi:hypothetical protein